MYTRSILFYVKRCALSFGERYLPAFPLIVALTYRCNLSCPYCNTKLMPERFPDEMGFSQFSSLVSWMRKSRIRKIMYTGGEPTRHTRFGEILGYASKNGFKQYLVSNASYPDSVHEYIAKYIKVLFVNCSTEYVRRERNLAVKRLNDLRKRGVLLVLRVNIAEGISDEEDLIDVAAQLNARIRVGIVNPSFGIPQPLQIDRERALVLRLRDFGRKCLSRKVYAYLAKPIPRCVVDEVQWRELRRLLLVKSRCFVGYRGNYVTRMVVNPDLSSFGCFNNAKTVPNVTLFDMRTLNKCHEEYYRQAGRSCLLDKENNCSFFRRGVCMGGCIAYWNSSLV